MSLSSSSHEVVSTTHPLVSTFLWLFNKAGKSGRLFNLSQDTSGSSNGVSWSDVRGGDIATVFKKQKGLCGHEGSNDVQSDGQLTPDGEVSPWQTSPGEDIDDDGQSPQWGFYVSISPSHGDIYPKRNREIMEKANNNLNAKVNSSTPSS